MTASSTCATMSSANRRPPRPPSRPAAWRQSALGDEVAKLVSAAQNNSDQAAARSADAIRYGKLLLLVISALSAAGAAAILLTTWCHGLSGRSRKSR